MKRTVAFFLIVLLFATPCHAVISQRYQALSDCNGEPVAQGWTQNLAQDFNYARCAPTYAEAKQRWQHFLARYDTPEGYEDGFHVNHVMSAHMELARVYYVLDDIVSGDKHYHQAMALW